LVSQKLKTTENNKWSKEGSYHILTTVNKMNGEYQHTKISKYDSAYNLLSSSATLPSGVYTTEYKYQDNLLAEISLTTTGTQKYYYTNKLLDSIVYYKYPPVIEKTAYMHTNKYGDPEWYAVRGEGQATYSMEVKTEYTYDSHGNWVTMLEHISGKKDKKFVERKITYYE
jgi:hypothetical protein